MSTACDTETCETCGTAAVEGLNQRGECLHCEQHPTSLETLLRLSLAGVTRDRKSGRFTSTKG
jgi:transcriptional regulator NrdR family protein